DGSNLWIASPTPWWIVSPQNTLDIRRVRIAWSGKDFVYVADEVRDGESLIISGLATPVQGMALRVASPKDRGPATRPSTLPSRPNRKEQPR
ncbi:MAG: hypothetical protein V3S01_04320, partial [Dehalococcoidia bacterium]